MSLVRAAGMLAFGTVIVLVIPTPASAHAQNGIAPSNYRSEISAVAPGVPGLYLRLLDLGRRVELTNNSPSQITVLGYQREPYLRVGAAGSYENAQSPTLKQNRVLPPGVPPTPIASPTAAPSVGPIPPPEWRKISGSHTLRWRDHRTRWEGPPAGEVLSDSHHRHVVSTWTIELDRAEAPVVVTGTISWIPPPPAWPWLLLAIAALGVILLAARSRRWGPLLAAVVAVLIAVDVALSVGIATFNSPSLPRLLLTLLLGGLISVLGWILGILAIGRLQQGQESGVMMGVGTGLIIGLFGGLNNLRWLGKSELPVTLPAGLARAGGALSLGLGLGTAAAALVVFGRHLPSPLQQPGETWNPPPTGSVRSHSPFSGHDP